MTAWLKQILDWFGGINMFKKIGIAAGWLAAWQIISMLVHNNILFVGPLETLKALAELLPTSAFWTSLGASCVRIIGGFALGSAAGILLAFAAYMRKFLADVLAPFVTALKAVPVASFVILLLIWSGSENLSLLISFLVVFPILYLNTLEGLRSTDEKLLEMASVYRVPLMSRIRYIFLPGLKAFWLSSFQLALGMSWKSGVAAEVIGQPLTSIGNRMYQSKIFLDTAGVLAWTVVIVFISWLFEKAFLLLMKKAILRTGSKEVQV